MSGRKKNTRNDGGGTRPRKSSPTPAEAASCENIGPSLEDYLNSFRREPNKITPQQLAEYVKEQREQIIDINRTHLMAKRNAKVYASTFLAVKILYVATAREFYAVEVSDLDSLTTFQNTLNQTYVEDCQPIAEVKVKDICAVQYDSDWCRCEVIDIGMKPSGRIRVTVQLIDYGRKVVTDKQKLYLLKGPHYAITPFAIKCQLSVLNADEKDLDEWERAKLRKDFKRVSTASNAFAVYVNALNGERHNTEIVYDVFLLAESQTNNNTTCNAYLLHEVYGAFIRSNIRFDSELCVEWSQSILQMATNSCNDYSRINSIHLSHIVSPMEVYVKSELVKMSMHKVQQKIDAFVNQIYDSDNIDSAESRAQREKAEWSIGFDCLVRMQSWKTQTILKLWFRGRIIGVDREKNTVRVYLRDYGRQVEVTHDDVIPISSELAAPGDGVQKCHLAISNVWLESSTDMLFELISEYKLFAISVKSKDERGIGVTLLATNASPDCENAEIWDDIGLMLVSRSMRISMDYFLKRSQFNYKRHKFQRKDRHKTDDSDTAGYLEAHDLMRDLQIDETNPAEIDQHPIEKASNANDCVDGGELAQQPLVEKWLKAMPIDRTTFSGTVVHIDEKGIIFFQEESDSETLLQLEQSVTSFIEKVNRSDVMKRHWKIADTCFVQYDGYFHHRAVIKDINREKATCLIEYVDYGNKCLVGLDHLFPATTFGEIPILVHRLSISNIKSGREDGKWFPDILQEVRNQLLNEICTVYVESVPDIDQMKILSCSIEPKHRLPSNISNWLLSKKLVCRIERDADNNIVLIV